MFGIAGFIQNHFRQFRVRQAIQLPPPAVEMVEQIARSVLRTFGFNSSVSVSSRAAMVSGILRARAVSCTTRKVASPMPRLGVLTIRSKGQNHPPVGTQRGNRPSHRVSPYVHRNADRQ